MEDLIKFEDTVSFVLAKVSTGFRTALEHRMGLIGLHGGQIFVLFELWKKDGQRQVDLAKKLDIAAPTIHKMVNGLIEIDLVTRAKYENDARSTRIFITPAGISKRPEIEAQWLELEANCLSCLNATERAVAFGILNKLRSNYAGRPAPEDGD
ncbi:MAG TPA: MarR family winged helix-turn-helix transcriptional regulator [Pyrinomonadaceae bacterium]|nr:winged helix-turn-helix transcriptional regulator [Chloracidobacterium sp.]MBP9936439.1 winged helix-turn-helix transcriptional regulator [Pyrinomonadaceae bacterium]MBK7803995.1 winged helix-turn-helix transcriptional regulator [Chloracidobacterium sp.]MBK9439334.1 winged helix-turn-helix transcriptional regulator [Chloracidobacterium sp.]MBK9768667.1 winged helix-turn-helix transcriptional regulator [Chloracidobacterium sp.]